MTQRDATPTSEPIGEVVSDVTGMALSTEVSAEDDWRLDCPTCGANLTTAELFQTFRVCPACRRHFPLPARERLTLLVDPASFVETNAALASVDPLIFRDPLPFADRRAEAQERLSLPDAVITGTGAICGQTAVLVVLDFAYFGGNIGVVAGEKITLAMELAAARHRPLVAVCSGGAARTQEGMLSLVQLAKTAAAAARLHRAGVPFISVLTHPTTGGVYAGLANQADIIFAEPGARIGFSAAREASVEGRGDGGTNSAEFLLAHGAIDGVVERAELRATLGTLLDLFATRGTAQVDGPPTQTRAGIGPPVWEEAGFASHPDRPTALTYIGRLMSSFVELHGDRVAADDPALVCGIGRLAGMTVAVIAQERGRGDERERRRAGRMRPAGYRKALRMMRLAGHLELPLLALIDTPGPESGPEAEADGIGVVLAQALALLSVLPVPVVSVVIGEGGSAGALALAIGDRMLMQEHAVYSVVGAEGKGPLRLHQTNASAGDPSCLNLTARECLRLGVIDAVVPEPIPAAHADPDAAAAALQTAILRALAELGSTGPRRLVDARARKIRQLGQATAEGREATRHELRELIELQRDALARSLGDLRDRWEGRPRGLPTLPKLHMPRPDLAGRVAALRSNVGPGAKLVLHEKGEPPAVADEDRGE